MKPNKAHLYIASKEEKLDLETCKKMLNRGGRNYSDEQILLIRDYFYQLAELQCRHFKQWIASRQSGDDSRQLTSAGATIPDCKKAA